MFGFANYMMNKFIIEDDYRNRKITKKVVKNGTKNKQKTKTKNS